MSYDDWKTRTPPCDEEPCFRCRKNQPDRGTAYCDDCLEDQRLGELFDPSDTGVDSP